MSGLSTYVTPAAPLRAFADELVRSGVRDVVVCPGSRSTPLALALRVHPSLQVWVHLDERAGAFFALGMAKASCRPTAILATSGTAVVNFWPAVVEARHGRVPLLLLTADRPPELRDRDAPQAIDQDHLYGRFAKWFVELPVPDDTLLSEAHLRGVVGRAVSTATAAPSGPVHLNLPFREPLLPHGSLLPEQGGDTTPYADVVVGTGTLPAADVDALARRVAQARRGLIVCGPLDSADFPAAVARLAHSSGFPIVADGLSNVRVGPHDRSHVMVRHDVLLRNDSFRAAYVPDLVLRFGGTPTSKALVETLREQGAPQIVVDDGGWAEPTLLPLTMVQAEPTSLAEALAGALSGLERRSGDGWLESWRAADAAADGAIEAWLRSLDEPFEGAIFSQLARALPDGALLFAGNGMPVWDLDAFLGSTAADVRCLGNRGANGIDGLVSTALGMAAVATGPVVAVVGDISFLHDLNALVAATRHGLSATIVLVNNDGGGIFSFLPQASAERADLGLPQHYEELFGTAPGVEPGPLVRALGGEHRIVATGDLGMAVEASIASAGVQVLEVRTERTRNVELHREVRAVAIEAVAAMLDRGTGPQ